MQSQLPTHSNADDVDVALPLHRAASVDVALPLADQAALPQQTAVVADNNFQPSLSQAAADVSVPRVRWPNRSRSGYHGGSGWNWMRDGHAGLSERSIGKL